MNIINKIVCRFFLTAFFVLASACNTVPTSSSSSTSGSPPPGGSSSSSSSSSGTSAGRQSSSQSTSGDKDAGKQSPAAQAGSKGAGEETGKAQTGAGQQGEQTEKSDDEILADALGEFDKKINKTQSEADEQGESNQQATGIGSEAGTGSASDNGQGAQTNAEKARKLDEQLNKKFAKFDDLMLGEREAVAKSDNAAGSGSGLSGMGNGPGDGDGGDGYAGNDPLQTAMANGSSTSGSLGVKSARQVDSISEAPADVGNGQDDDIIARQLREAAQKEQDPELRARLWDEYRKYKKGA